jgi:nitrogen fixation protein FixH
MRFVCLVLLASVAIGIGCAADMLEPVGSLETEDGEFQGHLEIDPEPSVGYHHVELELEDDDGEPLQDAEVTVSPFMPAHGHGSIDVVAEEDAPGLYIAERVWLNMPGRWDLRVYVHKGKSEGRLVATLEVP